MLSGEDFPLLLDVEEQRKEEDEVAAVTRLVERILKNYPRAFVYLNIKPELRYKHSNLYFVRLIFSGLYDGGWLL